MISFTGLNWWAIIVGVVVSNVVGMLWYGPLFGKAWLRMIGKRADEIEADPMMYVKTTLASLIYMIALAVIVKAFGANTLVQGLLVGALASIGISATSTYVYSEFEGPPTKVWFLFSDYHLVVFLIMGALFAIWP